MNSDNLIAIFGTFCLSLLAAYLSHNTYKKTKNIGVEDDMGFRLIWLIGAFTVLYGANLFREQINKFSTNELIYNGLAGIIILIVIYSIYVLLITVKTKLSELGTTKIWKKLLYSAVISTVAAWGSSFLGITEAITLAKVAIGGAVVFSVQLLG